MYRLQSLRSCAIASFVVTNASEMGKKNWGSVGVALWQRRAPEANPACPQTV